jgi:hypothetical protein
MAKRRTTGVQRRNRASEAAMNRRVTQRSGGLPIDGRLLVIGGILALGAVVFVIVLLFGGGGGTAKIGTQMPDEGAAHVPQTTVPTYQSVPATSGPHWNLGDGIAPLFWGVYTSPVAEPAAVHNLEHGGIVIWYQKTATQEDIDKLTEFTQQAEQGPDYKVILSPWNGKDFGHPIAVTAWHWLLYLDSADTDKIRQFQQDHPPADAPEPFSGPAQGAH